MADENILQNPEIPANKGVSASFFHAPEGLVRHTCRAKYIPTPDGGLRLVTIQQSGIPAFSASGWEQSNKSDIFFDDIIEENASENKEESFRRASRRARIAAMDFILCNPDMNVFSTLTFDPDRIDRTSYDDVYQASRIWLSNRVQRNGLKYIMVPEYHHDGKAIHYHMIANDAGLRLSPARYPNGRLMKYRARGEEKQVYNIADWELGFTKAELITGDNATDKVAKYILKYMTKQLGQRIGGRYFLHGGDLAKPFYAYGDDPAELMGDQTPTYTWSATVADHIDFTEYSFL